MTDSPTRRNPPPRRSRRRAVDGDTIWTTLLEPLMSRKNTGHWHLIRTYETGQSAASAAYDIRRGRKPGQPDGGWDATARDGELYACYLGPGDHNK